MLLGERGDLTSCRNPLSYLSLPFFLSRPCASRHSNSPFWYCDAGMNYVVGPDWRDQWDVVITSAGKPAFYTEDNRPFREVDIGTGKLKFKQVSVYLSTTVLSEFLL